jgi:hypothetical protein
MILTFTGSVSQTWNASASWTGNAIPTLLDDAVFNSLSPTCSSATNPVCKSLDFTNFNKTATITTTLGLAGDLTLSSSMSGVITILNIQTSSNVNTNNKQIITNITYGGDNVTQINTNLINPLTLTGNITLSLNPILFTGSYGFSCNSFVISQTSLVGSQTLLKPGLTYSVSILNIQSNNASIPYPIKSGVSGTRATFVLSATGSQTTVNNVSFIDVDASAGQSICVFDPGVLTNTLNITELAAYKIQSNQFYTN